MKRVLTLSVMAMAMMTNAASDDSQLELMLATAQANRPETYVALDQFMSILARIDANGDNTILNRFDDRVLDASTAMTMHILAPAWWSPSDRADVQSDLFNNLPCHGDVAAAIHDYPPGRVVSPLYDNGVWSVGTGLLGDTPVSMYQPPKGYEGDFARAALYVITLYGDTRWCDGNAWNFVGDSRWPGINSKSLRQLIAWHDADPVDDAERRRDAAVFAIQRNHNPFVVTPSLVRAIFDAGTPDLPVTPDIPDVPDEPSQYPPLRSTYSMADGFVGLNSPYIPAGAAYTVDGVAVTSEYVTTDSLGVGRHTIGFATSDFTGSLIIEILP